MYVIIMGCGRVGTEVCQLLVDEGHEVAVIDYNPAALDRLGAAFRGHKVLGVGFDRDVLLQAGIEHADAFAATSASDNSNIVAARLARNVFQVPKVVTRLYDPRRAEIYRRLGLVTISSTTWGAERIHELLTHGAVDPVHTFGSGEVCVVTAELPVHLAGRTVRDLTVAGEMTVVALTREGRAFIPLMGAQLQSGDQVHLVVLASALERLESWLELGEGQ
jgi:trk system potassium uptake protein TrkA